MKLDNCFFCCFVVFRKYEVVLSTHKVEEILILTAYLICPWTTKLWHPFSLGNWILKLNYLPSSWYVTLCYRDTHFRYKYPNIPISGINIEKQVSIVLKTIVPLLKNFSKALVDHILTLLTYKSAKNKHSTTIFTPLQNDPVWGC